MIPAGVTRAVTHALAGGVVVLALASCGGGEGGDGAGPSISPTATLPSPTRSADRTERPEPTRTRSEQPTEEPTEQPTDEPTDEPTEEPTEEPEPARSADRTENPDDPATQGSSAPTEGDPAPDTATAPETGDAGDEPAEDSAGDEEVPTWFWVLAALMLGAAVAIPLVVRSRRRKTWRQALVVEEREIAWLARELLPELRRGGSLEQVAGGWSVGRARVTAAEDRLTVLESTAPDDISRERARSLRDASRRAQADMGRLTGPGPRDMWALDLDAIIADLEATLRPPPTAGGPPAEPAGRG